MPEETDPPQPPPEQPTLLGNLAPDELLARGMQSVRMTSGTAGTWQPPTVEEAARLFRGYEVLKLLGRGGMGAVYQARQIELDRLVAIKLLPLEISVDKDFADRFRREARAMARLHHSNIITVHDFGTTPEGHLFFVMEYVEGANLADVIHQVGLDADQALSIVEQVCTALAYAHGKGIVHRDIKPANVMIDTESHVKVADFGLARLTDTSATDLGHTMTGTVMGTPDYMAPEQTRGMNVDHRADIYSLGVMLYEMLCREVPKGFFESPSARTGCDPRIDAIVIKAMHQSPDRRYQSTQEMKADVSTARSSVAVPSAATQEVHPRPDARPALPAPPKLAVMKAITPPAPRKSRVPLFGGIAAVVLAVGVLAYFAPWKKDTPGGARAVVPQTSVDGELVGQAPRLPTGGSPPPRPASGALGSPSPVTSAAAALPSATALFPAGRWVAVKNEWLPGGEIETAADGWMRTTAHGFVHIGSFAAHNAGLRGRFRGNPPVITKTLPELTLREAVFGDLSSGFQLSVAEETNGTALKIDRLSGPGRTKVNLAQKILPQNLSSESEAMVELYVVGRSVVVHCAGQTLIATTDQEPADLGMNAAIYGLNREQFRDLEVMNLDGLSEAEALKRTGTDGIPAPTSLSAPVPTAPASATKDAPYVNSLGMKFVPVPVLGGPTAGKTVLFSVWDTRVQDYAAYARENQVDDAWKKVQKDGVPVSREAEYPVVGVNWDDAKAFCKWLTDKEHAEGKLPKGMEYRLPTDEEWSRAVGLTKEEGATPKERSGRNAVDFPWGIGFPPVKADAGNYADNAFHEKFPNEKYWLKDHTDGYATTSPVGSFAPNEFGLFDMGGNVWQWCEDLFEPGSGERAMRGASWDDSDPHLLLSSGRYHSPPGQRDRSHGFRCVLAPVASNSPAAAASLSRSSEPWRDMLDSTKLSSSGGVTWTSEGLRLADDAWVWLRDITPERDGAVRMRSTFGNPSVHLQIRNTLAGTYKLYVFSEKRIRLDRWDPVTKQATLLREFPLATPLKLGEDYELELRAVGQTLTAKLNGEVLGTVTDGTFRAGSYGFLVINHNAAPTVVKAFEVLHLDTPATTSSPVTNIGAATKEAPFVNSLGMKFVPVPGMQTLFSVWDTRVQDYAAYAGAKKLKDRSWVMEQQDGVPVSREPDYPVVGVNWDDAKAFCQWLTEKESAEGKLPKGMQYRLPTDEEWSRAVGLPMEDGATPQERNGKNGVDFPWGISFPPSKAKVGNYADAALHESFPSLKWLEGYTDGSATTSPVGAFAPNEYGLYDMGGNVWQWCEDLFEPGSIDHVLRGAAWDDAARTNLLLSRRIHLTPGNRSNHSGFRCVLANDVPTP